MGNAQAWVDAQKRLIWFTTPTAHALTEKADWCGSLRLVGKHYGDNMPVLNQTVWDAQHAAGGAAFNHRTEL